MKKKLIEIYKTQKAVIMEMSVIVTNKTNRKSVLGALLITMSILLIPLLMIISLFLFKDLYLLLGILLILLFCGGIFIYFFMYYKLLKSYQEELKSFNTKLPFLFDSILISSILLVLALPIVLIIFL